MLTTQEVIHILCGAQEVAWVDCERCDHRYERTTWWGPIKYAAVVLPGTYGACGCPKRLMPKEMLAPAAPTP